MSHDLVSASGDSSDQVHLSDVLNQYRSAELRGAGVILRLGRLAQDGRVKANLTKHLRDEGVHAWMWTRTLERLGFDIVDVDDSYQQRLGAVFGIPRTVEDLLALTLISERRGVATYEEHLDRGGAPAVVERTLTAILDDERWHVQWISEELDKARELNVDVDKLLNRAEHADRVATAALRAHLVSSHAVGVVD